MPEFNFTRFHPTPLYFERVHDLLEQPDEARDRLLELARTSSSLSTPDEIDEIVAAVRGADPHLLYTALPSLGGILRDVPSTVTAEQVLAALMALAPQDVAERMLEHHDYLHEMYQRLLGRRDDLAIHALRSGPGEIVRGVKTATMLAAAVRPDESIAAYLPVALVRIETDQVDLVLQFDEARLTRFLADLEKVAAQLVRIRSDTADRIPLSDPIEAPN